MSQVHCNTDPTADGSENGWLTRLGLVTAQQEPLFDRLTELARERLGAAAALMTIVQPDLDRQFFKSAAGLEGRLAETRQTPLAHSFCKHVRSADAPFVVLDATTDPRVRDNPAIALYGVVAYLGYPIHLSGGDAIGALCVIDTVPRNWSEADIGVLAHLAALVDQSISLGELVGAVEAERHETAAGQPVTAPFHTLQSPPSGHPICLRDTAHGGAAVDGDVTSRRPGVGDAGIAPSAAASRPRRQMAGDLHEIAVATELWRGLMRRRFRPWYQPQVDARTRRIVGVEMLARWHREDGSVSTAGAFLPLAERLLLLDRIDDQVMRRATDDFRDGVLSTVRDLELSVNLTLNGLFRGETVDLLRNFRRGGRPISVEILESVSIESLDSVFDFQVDLLRDAGVRIGLDDFGSNRSSFLALARARPDYVKIDRRLVDLHTRPGAGTSPLRTIIDLAKESGAQVIAEGIETDRQAMLLTDLGADILQGYRFAKPLEAHALKDLLGGKATA